jgi:hypothetical protein
MNTSVDIEPIVNQSGLMSKSTTGDLMNQRKFPNLISKLHQKSLMESRCCSEKVMEWAKSTQSMLDNIFPMMVL